MRLGIFLLLFFTACQSTPKTVKHEPIDTCETLGESVSPEQAQSKFESCMMEKTLKCEYTLPALKRHVCLALVEMECENKIRLDAHVALSKMYEMQCHGLSATGEDV